MNHALWDHCPIYLTSLDKESREHKFPGYLAKGILYIN